MWTRTSSGNVWMVADGVMLGRERERENEKRSEELLLRVVLGVGSDGCCCESTVPI